MFLWASETLSYGANEEPNKVVCFLWLGLSADYGRLGLWYFFFLSLK